MDRFTKQSSEQFTIELNFSRRLETSETISSYELEVINNDTEIDVKSTIVDDETNDDDTIYVTVKAGDNGNNYKITGTITTSNDNIYEKDVIMSINDT